jgi:hypothetical protein
LSPRTSGYGSCVILKRVTVECGHRSRVGATAPPPQETAALAGYYRANDMLGPPIEQVVAMQEGERLPPLPLGFMSFLMQKW